MFDDTYNQIKIAAYFLWEYTTYDDTLALWHCSEDISSFLERCGICSEDSLYQLLRLSRDSKEYISFVRHIAYRIYAHTNITDELLNWTAAEKLLHNHEWRTAAVYIASAYARYRLDKGFDISQIKSEAIRKYYSDLS